MYVPESVCELDQQKAQATWDDATFLTNVKSVIEDPKKWMKGSYQQWHGRWIPATQAREMEMKHHHNSVCYCLMGAASMIGGLHGETRLGDLLEPLLRGSVTSFNDGLSTTHADVLALLDRAIEDASA